VPRSTVYHLLHKISILLRFNDPAAPSGLSPEGGP